MKKVFDLALSGLLLVLVLPACSGKGIKVVTFDSVPYKDGDPNGELLRGVTSTAQEDADLAWIPSFPTLTRANNLSGLSVPGSVPDFRRWIAAR
jgi:hypothetical protein